MKHLMQKRFIVIADYPDSPHIVGDLILVNKEGMHVAYGDNGMYLTDVAAYPHIFRELSWWEYVDESEIESIQFVKITRMQSWMEAYFNQDQIVEVIQWEYEADLIKWHCKTANGWVMCDKLTPATESEYNEYIKTTTNER